MKWGMLLLLSCSLINCAGRSGPLRWAMEDELRAARQLISSGRHRQAVDDLSMILEMNPEAEEGRFLRGIAYQELEEFELAIQDYQALLKQNPRHARAHYNLGMIYGFKTGEPSRAIRHWDQFLTLEPDHPKAFTVAKMIRAAEASLEQPFDPSLHGELGSIAVLSDPHEKQSRLQRLISEHPESPVPHYLLGKLFEANGDETQAIRCYRQALEVRPSCALCHQALGDLLATIGQHEAGRLHLRKAELYGSLSGSEGVSSAGVSGVSEEGTGSGGGSAE